MKRASVAYIVREDGLMLSVTRPDTGQHAAPGGRLEPDETHEHALSREIMEEAWTVVTKAWRVFEGVFNGWIVWVYRAEISGEPQAVEPYTRAEWVTPERIANGFASEMHREALVAAGLLAPGFVATPTLREQLTTIAANRMAGSTEPMPRYWVYFTSGPSTNDYVQESFCQKCAQIEVQKISKRGESATIERLNDEPDETIQYCGECDATLTFALDRRGAIEELAHWESDWPSAKLSSPDDWRAFVLCLKALDDEHLPRAQVVVERNTKQPWATMTLARDNS
jgi:ADP-ribose pyrophosphatase YjhB (NUDIX family)